MTITIHRRPFTRMEWEHLKDLNFANRTNRGYRGGKLRHKHLIPVCITQRSSTSTVTRDHRGVTKSNLTQIPVQHDQRPSIIQVELSRPIQFTVHLNQSSQE